MELKTNNLKKVCLKGGNEPFWIAKYFERPVSINLSKIFIKMGMHSNTITFLSFISAAMACVLLMFKNPYISVWAAFFIYFYEILDCCDGEVARYNINVRGYKATKDGMYLDWLVHGYSQNLFFFFIGYNAYLHTGKIVFIMLGLINCINFSNLHNFILSNALIRMFIDNKKYQDNSSFLWLVNKVAVLENNNANLSNNKSLKNKLFILAKEILMYPGILYVMIFVIVIDSLFKLDSYLINLKTLFTACTFVYLSLNTILHVNQYKNKFKEIGF